MFKRILLGLIVVLALAIAGIFLFAKDFTVKISEATAQEAINAQIERGPIKPLGVEITLQKAKIDFRADNTTAISASFDTLAFGYPSHVEGTFQSGIRYSAPRIYLDNIIPVEIDVRTSDETKNELAGIKSAARKFLERQKKNVKSDKNTEVIDKIIGKDNSDFQKSIVKGSYAFFELIPVYDLNQAGYKGSLASLALKDVQFSEDYATITLSPVQALVKILTLIGALFLTLLYLGKGVLASMLLNKLTEDKPPKVISGYVDVPPADRADFALALPEHTRLTNMEKGCHYFRVMPDSVIEGRYVVEESFEDEAAYEAHMERTRQTKWAHITRNIKRSYNI